MNIKKIGTEFEKELCKVLALCGYWVHFITPNAAGQQPFDILAVRKGTPLAIDCKTCVQNSIPYTRLEDDQKTAFELWLIRGNNEPIVAVKHDEKIYRIPYTKLRNEGRVKLTDEYIWAEVSGVYRLIHDKENER